MQCTDLDIAIEGAADGSRDPGADGRAHLASCAACQRRLRAAGAIHSWLTTRDVPAPPPGFTARVMARVQGQQWQAERVIDLGFNLAVAMGVLLLVGGGVGLAWSLGFVGLHVDLGALIQAGAAEWSGTLVSKVQTIAMAAALLMVALGLWWWAESDLSL